ncbi:hypothetical protein [Azotobacter armeniacus]
MWPPHEPLSPARPQDRKTAYLLPPSMDDWLPESHPASFILEAMERLGLGALTRAYAGHGSAAHHPEVLLGPACRFQKVTA